MTEHLNIWAYMAILIQTTTIHEQWFLFLRNMKNWTFSSNFQLLLLTKGPELLTEMLCEEWGDIPTRALHKENMGEMALSFQLSG